MHAHSTAATFRLVNLTPHPLAFYPAETPDIPPPGVAPTLVVPSRGVARAAVQVSDVAEVDVGTSRLALRQTVLGEVHGLPAVRRGVLLVVSLVVFQACPRRTDLVVVDRAVRDERGRVVGARGLAQPAGAGVSRAHAGSSRKNRTGTGVSAS